MTEDDMNNYFTEEEGGNKKVSFDVRLAYMRNMYNIMTDVRETQRSQAKEAWLSALKTMYSPVHSYGNEKLNDEVLHLFQEIENELFSPPSNLSLNQQTKDRRILKKLFECTNKLYEMAKPIMLPMESNDDDDFFTEEGFMRQST